MPTKSDKNGHAALTVAQESAIDCLIGGATDAEAAEAVGVQRQTVNGWKNHDPAFIAALNTRRADLWGHSADRLRALVPRALTALEHALDTNADPRVALDLLKLAGVADAGAPLGKMGPTSPDEVLTAEILRQREANDPLDALMTGGHITDRERTQALGRMKALSDGGG
jgi:hypothetical protein